jgi:hypothetical protein
MPNFTATQWPPLLYPSPEPEVVQFQPAPKAPNATAYQSSVTTQQGIYNLFGIIDGRLATQTP